MSQNSAVLSTVSAPTSIASVLREAHLRRRGMLPTIAVIAAVPHAPTLTVVPAPEPIAAPEVAPAPAERKRRGGRPRKVAAEPAIAVSVANDPVSTHEPTELPTFNHRALLAALRRVAAVADKRSTMPILATTAMRIGADGRTEMVATDLAVSISVTLNAKSPARHGTGLIAVKAADAVKTLASQPRGETTLTVDGMYLRVANGPAKLTLAGMMARDFPKIPDTNAPGIEWATCDAGTLVDWCDRVLPSVCKDETRFHLNGAFLECDGEHGSMVSTDGHRLTRITGAFTGPKLHRGVIIPAKGLAELAKLGTGPCELAVKGPHLFARQGGVALAIKLIDAQFPPYEQVIPKSTTATVTLNRAEMIAALKRVLSYTSDTRGAILSVTDDGVHLGADHPDMGTFKESLNAITDGNHGRVGFKPSYWIDALGTLTGDMVEVGFNHRDELHPMILRTAGSGSDVMGSSALVVVMPMRL